MSCRLIINADDFGWSRGVNEAVALLSDEGAITSTSLMVGGLAAREAVEIARARPALPVGLHLTLVHGYPLLPPEDIPLLVDSEGRLPRRYAYAGLMATCSPAWRRQMLAEMRAQFKAFEETRLPWSHVDGHVHFTLTPCVFREALRLCREYRVPGFRVPQDDWPRYRTWYPEETGARWFEAQWFEVMCTRQRPAVAKAGLQAPLRCYGFFRSGRVDLDFLLRLVETLPDGDLELHCHPDLETDAGRLEVQALRSLELRQALDRRGVERITYPDLSRTG
jgi:chitin disaccharide deacetylase